MAFLFLFFQLLVPLQQKLKNGSKTELPFLYFEFTSRANRSIKTETESHYLSYQPSGFEFKLSMMLTQCNPPHHFLTRIRHFQLRLSGALQCNLSSSNHPYTSCLFIDLKTPQTGCRILYKWLAGWRLLARKETTTSRKMKLLLLTRTTQLCIQLQHTAHNS